MCLLPGPSAPRVSGNSATQCVTKPSIQPLTQLLTKPMTEFPRAHASRAIRSQRFLEFTEEDLRSREAKQMEIWRKLTAPHGKVSGWHAGPEEGGSFLKSEAVLPKEDGY